MSSSAKGMRSNKGSKSGRNSTQSGSQSQGTKPDHNHNEKPTKLVHKIAPTAEQLRIAHMIENTNMTEQALQEKITQVTQVTGVSTDDAIIALHDCNYEVTGAIDSLLEGDDQGEWKESTKKKKKPAPKTKQNKDEAESNKENRRLDNKHGPKSRGNGSRGRGGRGGKFPKDDGQEGAGRGRKPGRMANGSAGSYRGRGNRGRGSGGFRSFQNRQPPAAFTEKIDTWDWPEKTDSSAGKLKIDTWDEEPTNTEDWDNEWTGSLETTTVFGPSSSGLAASGSDSIENTHSVPGLPNNVSASHGVSNATKDPLDSHGSSVRDSSTSLSDSVSPLGNNQRVASGNSKTYGAAVTSNTGAMPQNQDMDFASLLQKTAPHSTLGRLVPSGDTNQSAGSQNMTSMSNSIDDGLKSGSSPKSYSSSSNNGMFQNPNLSNSAPNDLRTSLANQKVMNVSQQQGQSRSKTTTRRPAQPAAKISSSGVEMPDTMASLELQFSGLEFGTTETFEFGDVQGMNSNNVGTGNTMTHNATSTANVSKDLANLPSLPQQQTSMQNYETSTSSASMSGSLPTSASVASNITTTSLNTTSNTGQVKTSVPSKNGGPSVSMPPGVNQLPNQSQPLMPHGMSQNHHQLHQTLAQQNQQMMTGPSQYVPPPVQGNVPTFYNVQTPAMYSFEDLQMFQQRIPHMQQPPTTLPRDASINTPAAYSGADGTKFRSDQNSSPVPSTMNQQGGTPGTTYITATGNAAIPPFYMYHHNMVPNSFPQYGPPTIIQLPPNSHTGTSSTQFPGPPKLPYGGSSNYSYEGMSQSQDYKSGYGSSSQGQNKSGATSASGTNAGSDLGGYKNHLNKVGRTYDKQSFHSGTPPPFNLTGSAASNAIAANAYGPAMFFSTVPATAQHHSPLMHHQLHQDGTSANSQRSGVGSNQNKGSSKGYSGSYWGN